MSVKDFFVQELPRMVCGISRLCSWLLNAPERESWATSNIWYLTSEVEYSPFPSCGWRWNVGWFLLEHTFKELFYLLLIHLCACMCLWQGVHEDQRTTCRNCVSLSHESLEHKSIFSLYCDPTLSVPPPSKSLEIHNPGHESTLVGQHWLP